MTGNVATKARHFCFAYKIPHTAGRREGFQAKILWKDYFTFSSGSKILNIPAS